MRPGRRVGALLLTVVGLTALGASPAAADPAGPTNFESEITGVDPDLDSIALRMLGGDSFLELAVEPGVEVVVIGYQGEAYLRFAPDGTVFENTRAPSTYLNEERYGVEELPAVADADAEPVWSEVGRGGRWSWHDHRTHWMNTVDPPGAQPGDVILEAVVPLLVDGADVKVDVRSTWVASPSPIGAILGVVAVAVLLGGGLVLLGRLGAAALAALTVAVGATVVGWWQVASLPAETAPSPILWILPLVALICAGAGAGLAARRRGGDVAAALVVLAGLELLLWGWFRIDGITKAILPTNAPFALDRGVTVAALAAGLAALAVGGLDYARRFTASTAASSA